MEKPVSSPSPAQCGMAALSPPPQPRQRRRLLAIAVAMIALLGAAAIWYRWSSAQDNGRSLRNPNVPPPQSVRIVTAKQADIPIMLNALGTVTPLATVIVRPQLAGTLFTVGFHEGQFVKKGDFLAQIDPRSAQLSLKNAQAVLAKDRALLKQAQANLARYEQLDNTRSIAKQQVDDQRYLVEQYQAIVKADQAQIDTDRLNVNYCQITAPISGRVGLRQVDPGNYVQPTDTNGIVTITQLQPISVLFSLPEDNLPQLLERLHRGARLPVYAYDRGNKILLETGHLQTIDNQVDTSTGTVKLRASFANPQQRLFPNQFVNIRLLVDTLRNATTVPSSAVQIGPQGSFVYIVRPDRTVTVRLVKAGPTDGERTAIRSGVAPGEQVVIDGVDRLRDGAKITISPVKDQEAESKDQP